MNAWSHLPNAHHIDWVLQSLKDNLELWTDGLWSKARDAAWDAAWDAAYDATLNAARDAAWEAAYDAARDLAWAAALNAAWDALLALVAYDDCSEYLSMTYDELRVWARLSEDPRAILLLPLKWVLQRKSGQQSVDLTADSTQAIINY